YLGQKRNRALECGKIRLAQVVSGIDAKSGAAGAFGATHAGVELAREITACVRERVRTGIDFHAVRADLRGALEFGGVRIDEQADAAAVGFQRSDQWREARR